MTLSEFLAGIPFKKWDLLLIGDASGCEAEAPSGWSCVSIVRNTLAQRIWTGAASSGLSINQAEAVAFLTPLVFFSSQPDLRLRNILILTDSSSLLSEPRYRKFHAKNLLGFATRLGLNLHFAHVPRNSFDLHFIVDQHSKIARLTFDNHMPKVELPNLDSL